MNVIETWLKLLLAYWIPWLTPILIGLGVCGCVEPIRPVDPTAVLEAAIRGGTSRQSFPPGTLPPGSPMANTGISLEGDAFRETTAETWYPDGTHAVRVETKKAGLLDKLLILGSGLSKEQQALLLMQYDFANSLFDRIDAKLAPFEALLQTRLTAMVDQANRPPGPPQNNQLDAITRNLAAIAAQSQQMYEWAKTQPGFPSQAAPVPAGGGQ